MKRTRRDLEIKLGMSLQQVLDRIFGNDFKKACDIVLDEKNILLLKEAHLNGYVNLNWKVIQDKILGVIKHFIKSCDLVLVEPKKIEPYNIHNIKVQIIMKILNVNIARASDLVRFINSSNSKLSEIINEKLNAKAKELRNKKIKAEAKGRITEDCEKLFEDFQKSGLSFEDYALSKNDENITVGTLQRLVLDFELLGKGKLDEKQVTGFCLEGYLNSFDNCSITYIIFENEKIMLQMLEAYGNSPESYSSVKYLIRYPNSSKVISIPEILKYYKRFYPKAYDELMKKKSKIKEDAKTRKVEEEKAIYDEDCAKLYQEKGLHLKEFEEFLGDEIAFMKQYGLNEEEFNKLLRYLELNNPEFFASITKDIDTFYEDKLLDYINALMTASELFNRVGRSFFEKSSLYSFTYEYYRSEQVPLSELVEFVNYVKLRKPKIYNENCELMFPIWILRGLGTSVTDVFDIEEYLKSNNTVNGVIIDRQIVENITNRLAQNNIPLLKHIVLEAIRKYTSGALDEFIKSFSLNKKTLELSSVED